MNKNQDTIYRTLLAEWIGCAPGTRLASEYELAARFAVGRMTAHRICGELAGTGLVTRRRHLGTVRAAISEYKTRRLRAAASRRAAVVYASNGAPIHWDANTLAAAERELTQSGFEAVRFPLDSGSWKKPEAFFEMLEREHFGRVLLFPCKLQLPENAFRTWRESPLYLLLYNYAGAELALPNLTMVCLDDFGDGIIMGRMLRENGFDRVLMAGSHLNAPWDHNRHHGLCEGLNRNIPLIHCTNENMPGLLRFVRENGKESMIVATNCEYAAAATGFLERENLRSGHDYSLTTFADNPNFANYRFTGLEFPREAAGKLMGRLAAEPSTPNELFTARRYLMRSTPVIRGSTIRSLRY